MLKGKQVITGILALVLLMGTALAAGGGGGGGSGSSGVSPYTDLECNDAGSISFTRGARWEEVTILKKDENMLFTNVSGSWDGSKFTSEEAILNAAGRYIVQDPRYGNKSVQCPGLKFSCKLVGLSIEECVSGPTGITARITMDNATTDDVKLQFSLRDSSRILTYSAGSYSTELRGIKINKISSSSATSHSYQVVVPGTLEVQTFQVSLPQCVGEYYRYVQRECRQESAILSAERRGEQLKCGGYLELPDRVQCRLNLREEQADEYENFFPEECRSWENQGDCVSLYKAVQPCWKLAGGAARISCLRKIVLVGGDIRSAVRNCQGDASCMQEVRNKVYTLIKLRLYNLEEAAEGLLEEGKVAKEDVVDFVVKMEQSKLAFNQAANTEERRAVILQARQYWQELLQKIEVEG